MNPAAEKAREQGALMAYRMANDGSALTRIPDSALTGSVRLTPISHPCVFVVPTGVLFVIVGLLTK